jgi:O-antigen ligase
MTIGSRQGGTLIEVARRARERHGWTVQSVDLRAAAVAGGGLWLLFAAPLHRLDLALIGVAMATGGVLWCPMVGPLLIGFSLPFFFFARPLIGPLGVTPPGFSLLITWLAALARPKHVHLKLPRTPYDAPLALFLIAALLSLTVTEYPLLSARELRSLVIEPVLFFLLLYAVPGTARVALAGFLGGATVTALTAITETGFAQEGTQAEGVLRAQAWYPSANHLALMLGRALPFFVAGVLAGWRWLAVPGAIVAAGILLSYSTGGWLGALAAVLVVLATMQRTRLAIRLGLVAGVLLLAVSTLAVGGLLPERLNPLRQTGGFRLDLWVSTIEMIRDHPLLGVGLDNFTYLYQQVYLREGAAAEPNLSHPHNWLLHFWVELGVLGVVALLWLLWRFAMRARVSLADPRCAWVTAGAVGAMVDLLVHGFIDNSYFLVDLAFVFWLSLALVAEARIDGS